MLLFAAAAATKLLLSQVMLSLPKLLRPAPPLAVTAACPPRTAASAPALFCTAGWKPASQERQQRGGCCGYCKGCRFTSHTCKHTWRAGCHESRRAPRSGICPVLATALSPVKLLAVFLVGLIAHVGRVRNFWIGQQLLWRGSTPGFGTWKGVEQQAALLRLGPKCWVRQPPASPWLH